MRTRGWKVGGGIARGPDGTGVVVVVRQRLLRLLHVLALRLDRKPDKACPGADVGVALEVAAMGDQDPRENRDVVPDKQEHPAQIRIYARAGAVVLSIRGAVDVAATVGLRYAVDMAFQAPSGTPVVVDLTAVSHFCAEGLQALVDAHRDAGGERQPLRIVLDRARPAVRPIQVTSLSPVLALYHELDDAINARPDGPDGA
jgi:anti-sigma B factor antagonist